MSKWAMTKGDGFVTAFLPDATVHKEIKASAAVDLNEFGELLGIEILDFQAQTHRGAVEATPRSSLPIVSYDPEADAAYLLIGNGHARTTEDADVVLGLSLSGALIAVTYSGLP